jgi:thiol-disulfide isomerase/thioredoxin
MFERIKISRRRFLRSVAMTIASAHFSSLASAKMGGVLSTLARGTTWLNSSPLTEAELLGKVVLVEFWTYSCINWRRQLPYVRAWAEKYKEYGLVVIGVHSPEFSFEKIIDNIRWAAKDMRIGYPIAVDSDHAIWNGFANQYWPALYFVDVKGRIRHHQYGEGEYSESERTIQKLLGEAGRSAIPSDLVSLDPRGAEAQADWNDLQSAENYLGYLRTQSFVSGTLAADKTHLYSPPKRLGLNEWALSGDWTAGREGIVSTRPGARIRYCFHARDLHLVMGPVTSETPVQFCVLMDGHPPGNAHGVDVDEQGNGTAIEQRMYQLIRQATPIASRVFEIEFLAPGVEAFSFTFG